MVSSLPLTMTWPTVTAFRLVMLYIHIVNITTILLLLHTIHMMQLLKCRYFIDTTKACGKAEE